MILNVEGSSLASGINHTNDEDLSSDSDLSDSSAPPPPPRSESLRKVLDNETGERIAPPKVAKLNEDNSESRDAAIVNGSTAGKCDKSVCTMLMFLKL